MWNLSCPAVSLYLKPKTVELKDNSCVYYCPFLPYLKFYFLSLQFNCFDFKVNYCWKKKVELEGVAVSAISGHIIVFYLWSK